MKRVLIIVLTLLLIVGLTSCLKFKEDMIRVDGVVFSLHSGNIVIEADKTMTGFEITLNESISPEAVKVSSDYLKIVKNNEGMTTVAVVKPSGDIQEGEKILTILGKFRTLKGIVVSTKKEFIPMMLRVSEPLPDGISIRDTVIDRNSEGVFYIHAQSVNGIGGSELNITFDPAYIEIDTTKGNNGVEALNTYSSGMMIVQVNNEQGTLLISTAFTSLEGISIASEDIYAVHVKTKFNTGTTTLAMSGEFRDPDTNLLNVLAVGGKIEIGAPKLLGDFDENRKVDLDDFILFAQHYNTSTEDGDGIYEVVYDIAPAEDHYGGEWTGIFDKCNPDGTVGLSDFIIFAKNYYMQKPNEAPVWLDIPDQKIIVGFEHKINLSDYMFEPDGESVTYAIVEGPGEINGDYYDCSNITEPGQYSVSIEASDGISSSTISFNISAYKLFGKWTGYYYEGDSVEIEVTFTESDFQITYIAENYTITGTYTVDTSIYPANIDLFIDEPVYGILKFEDDTLYISINDPRPSDFSQNNILLVLESTEQILTELTIGGPETLDPHYCYETAGGAVILNVYDNLIKYKGDSVTVFEPMISTEVPTVENGLIKDGGTKYVFPIREGIKFHSGNVLTPYDVEYSFERGILFDPSGGPMWMIIEALSGGDYASLEGWFEAYSGMAYSDAVDEDRNPTSEEAKAKLIAFYNEVIDPLVEVDGNNVVFTLHGPFAPFMWIISHYAGWSAVIDSQWAKDNGAWDGNADGWWKWHDLQPEETPLHSVDAGCGPFKVVEWDRAQQKVILERFDEYWRGPAKLKTVIIWGIDEYSTRKAMLEAGDADIVYVPTQYKEQVVNMPGVRIIDGYPTSAITSFHFNWSIDPSSPYIGSGQLDGNGIPPDFFSDPHVRKAFYYCYDGQTFIEEVLNGYGKLVPTDLPEGYLGYDETLPIPELNLTAAASEFQQAFSGELWEKGFTLTLLYNTGNETRQAAAEMFKSNIESLNQKFHIDVQGVQWSEYYNAQIDGHMPAFILGWLADYPDPHNFLATFYASYGIYASRQGTAFVEFAKDNIDGLINTAIKETDPAKRDELYKEVQRIAIDNTLGVSLYMPLGFHVERDWVQGWYPHPMRSGTNYYELSKSQ